jgi:hypothetical protein
MSDVEYGEAARKRNYGYCDGAAESIQIASPCTVIRCAVTQMRQLPPSR